MAGMTLSSDNKSCFLTVATPFFSLKAGEIGEKNLFLGVSTLDGVVDVDIFPILVLDADAFVRRFLVLVHRKGVSGSLTLLTKFHIATEWYN